MLHIINNPKQLDYGTLTKYQQKDYEGQLKALPVLKNLFKNCSDLIIEHHILDNGRIDIFVTATTNSNVVHKYAIECKHRDFSSTTYDSIMLNPDKWGWLIAYSKLGYKPLFFNTFTDNTYMIWDVRGEWDVAEVTVPVSTVDKSKGKTVEPRFYLPNNKAIAKGQLVSAEDE